MPLLRRLSDTLSLEYPKTERVPGNRIGPISWAVTCIVTSIVVIINVALVGYDTVTIFNDKFNTPDRHWYNAFRPSYKAEQNCGPVLYRDGDMFRTNVSLFGWQVESVFNTSGTKSLEYQQQPLEGCSLRMFSAQVWIKDWRMATKSMVECKFAESVVMHMQTSSDLMFTHGVHHQFDKGVSTTNINNQNKSATQIAAETAFILASVDVTQVQGPWHPPQRDTNPLTYFEAQIDFPFCPRSGSSSDCTGDIAKLGISDSSVLYNNGELRIKPTGRDDPLVNNVTSTFTPALNNLAQVMLAAIKLDIGDNRTENIFLTPSVINDTLFTSFPMTDGTTPNLITYLLGLSTNRPVTYPSPPDLSSDFGPSIIQSAYLCRFYQLKTPGSLIVSVFAASWTIAAGGWGLYMFIIAWWYKYRQTNDDVESRRGLLLPRGYSSDSDSFSRNTVRY